MKAPCIYTGLPGLSCLLSSSLLNFRSFIYRQYLGDLDITSHLTYPYICLLRAVTLSRVEHATQQRRYLSYIYSVDREDRLLGPSLLSIQNRQDRLPETSIPS